MHDIPNAEVQSVDDGIRRRSVKYVKSSYELFDLSDPIRSSSMAGTYE